MVTSSAGEETNDLKPAGRKAKNGWQAPLALWIKRIVKAQKAVKEAVLEVITSSSLLHSTVPSPECRQVSTQASYPRSCQAEHQTFPSQQESEKPLQGI